MVGAQHVATLDTSGETTFEAINAVVQESAVPMDRAPKRMEGALQHTVPDTTVTRSMTRGKSNNRRCAAASKLLLVAVDFWET